MKTDKLFKQYKTKFTEYGVDTSNINSWEDLLEAAETYHRSLEKEIIEKRGYYILLLAKLKSLPYYLDYWWNRLCLLFK